ncbi:MAG: excinuclease ABC subunit UvrC [bacterium]
MSRGESRARRRERLLRKAKGLPDAPGTYQFLDASGRPIYVGKASSLRARVRSYFSDADDVTAKTRRMVEHAYDLDFLVTRSEMEALLLEYNLIKEHRPRYNVVYRDDKRYPYLKVTVSDPFPRVVPTRKVEDDGARYFGPYTDVGAMRRTLRILGTMFPLPTCSLKLVPGMHERGCLDWFLSRCVGPCRGDVDPVEYRKIVDEVILFLEGKKTDVVGRVEREMARAAREQRFEDAARLRDRLFSLRATVERQDVTVEGRGDVDVLALARLGRQAVGVLLTVRGGKVLGRDRLEIACTPAEPESGLVRGLLLGFYHGREDLAKEVLVPAAPPDAALLGEWLSSRAGRRVRIRVPRRGDSRRLLALAEENAQVALVRSGEGEGPAGGRAAADVEAAAKELGLATRPRRIEGFDISTIQGTDTYASMVVFVDGAPAKGEYRTYRIREAPRRDDPRAIEEVVRRRARRIAAGGASPDLLLIDGGPTQLAAATRALAAEGLGSLAAVSLAKREEIVYFPDRGEPLRLPAESAARRLLQRVRDEAHRFALRAHRRRRGVRMASSALDDVPGIGPARRRVLLERFGSVGGIREAGLDAIAAVPGIGRETALAVWTHLGGAEDR